MNKKQKQIKTAALILAILFTLLTLLRGIADAGCQRDFIAITQEAGQRQLCHQFLLCHDGFLPLGSHQILCMRKAMQMP